VRRLGYWREIRTEEEEGDLALASGAHTSARQGGNRDTVSGKTRWAAGSFSDLGRGVPRGPFLFSFLFHFFFSVFLFLL
jgi:hypothetical protein